MQALRNAVFLARLVLVWFALSIGVAVASPVIKPQSLELVCSGSGAIKLLAQDGDGSTPAMGHLLDCPLCVSTAAPPPAIAQAMLLTEANAIPVQPAIAARIAARASPPLPARGPPSQRAIQ